MIVYAGELMTFWSQLGFVFGKFSFVGWTRGWYAEDTENNFDKVKDNKYMHQDIIKTYKWCSKDVKTSKRKSK